MNLVKKMNENQTKVTFKVSRMCHDVCSFYAVLRCHPIERRNENERTTEANV